MIYMRDDAKISYISIRHKILLACPFYQKTMIEKNMIL